MKKVWISTATAALVFCMVSCYRDDLVINTDSGTTNDPLTKANAYLSGDNHGKMAVDPEHPHRINNIRAMMIAERVPGLFDATSGSARSMPKQVLDVLPMWANSPSRCRSVGNDEDVLMYVVNFAREQGFAVISFDDRDGEILAYFEEGNFNIQDTVGDPALKLHIDMLMSHQQYTRDEIRVTEEQGGEYIGSFERIELNESTEPAFMAAGLPGGGGLPGLPGNTPNPNYPDRRWEGKDDVIDLAEQRYDMVSSFGAPNNPPNIPFTTGPGGFLGPGTPCTTSPYCDPPLQNYEQYYYHYGATFFVTKDVLVVPTLVEPLMKTYWSQGTPLNYGVPRCEIPFHFNCANTKHAGCAPIAMGQMMCYHKWPLQYSCDGHTHPLNFALWEGKKSNALLSASSFGDDVGRFIREIGNQIDVTYTCNGSGPMSLATGTGKIQDAFIHFGYSIGFNGAWNYKDEGNFWRVAESILNKQPIFIYGFPRGWTGILNYFEGHCWVLDGYVNITKKSHYYEHYFFDEYGYFCDVKRGVQITVPGEFVHTNMGRAGSAYEKAWIKRGVYDRWGEVFDGKYTTEPEDYSGKIYYIAGIKPRK